MEDIIIYDFASGGYKIGLHIHQHEKGDHAMLCQYFKMKNVKISKLNGLKYPVHGGGAS